MLIFDFIIKIGALLELLTGISIPAEADTILRKQLVKQAGFLMDKEAGSLIKCCVLPGANIDLRLALEGSTCGFTCCLLFAACRLLLAAFEESTCLNLRANSQRSDAQVRIYKA